jgi:hypothetical protein
MRNFPSCFRRGPALYRMVQGQGVVNPGIIDHRWGCSPAGPTPRPYDRVVEVRRTRRGPCSVGRQAVRRDVAQGSRFSLAALPPRPALDRADGEGSQVACSSRSQPGSRIIRFAARQVPAPLEKPQGRRAGPALPCLSLCRPGRILCKSGSRRVSLPRSGVGR